MQQVFEQSLEESQDWPTMHLFSTHVCPFRQSLSSIHPESLQALAIHSCPILHSESSLQFVHLPSTLHTCPFGQSALLIHSGGEIHSPSTHDSSLSQSAFLKQLTKLQKLSVHTAPWPQCLSFLHGYGIRNGLQYIIVQFSVFQISTYIPWIHKHHWHK